MKALRRLLALALVSVGLLGAFAILNDRGGILNHRNLLDIGREWIESRSPARAAQGSLCMPTVGTVSGLTFANDVNAAIAALVSANSGNSAPANTCAGTPVEGQFWVDTSASPHKVKVWDGSSTWVVLGYIDPSNHVFVPVVGGGNNSLASATTTDLWSVSQAAVTVSGTTTITALAASSATPGTLKLVKFSGILTLTHNGTSLILPNGGSNITTANGDYALVLALTSTNVAVVNYVRASGQPIVSQISSIATTYPICGGTITTSGTLTYCGPTSSGLLAISSTTAITFTPKRGDLIRINGVVFQIPTGGITGCTSTGAFVNGTGSSNLSASTLYYVYAFSNSGTVTCDFSTTIHATSVTAGNIGTEIKNGDDTRSLIGMILTDAASHFIDSASIRTVRSWFNDPGVAMLSAFTANRSTASLTYVEINTEIRINFLAWTGEVIQIQASGPVQGGGTGATNTSIAIDGTTPEDTYSQTVLAGANQTFSLGLVKTGLSEGSHFATLVGNNNNSGGTSIWTGGSAGARSTLRGFAKL